MKSALSYTKGVLVQLELSETRHTHTSCLPLQASAQTVQLRLQCSGQEGAATGMSDKAGTSKLQILTGTLKIHHMTSSSPLRTEVGVVMFHGTRGTTVSDAGTARSVQRDAGPNPSQPLEIKVNHVMTSEEREHRSDKGD